MKITTVKLVAITSFAIASLLMGCSEEIYDIAYKPSLESRYLSVYPRDFEFGNGVETKTGSIRSENAWSFTSVPSWLSLSPLSENYDADFTVTSKTNESVSNREAVFYVSTNNTTSKIQRTLTASQTGSSPYITFPEYSSSTITLEGKSQCLIININSNIPDLTATFSQPWGSASYNSEAMTVNVEIQANETNSSRNGTLTVSSSQYSKTAKLTLSQLASGVTVIEGGAMDFDAEGGSQKRTIKSDLPWTAKTTYSWIEFSPKSGNAGETTMTITTLPSYESDKRIGQIYFYYGDTEKKYIGITQAGRYINLSEKTITLSADKGEAKTITVDSNIDWKVTSTPDWVTVTPTNTSVGKNSITISATMNNSLIPRSGTIVIKDAQSGSMSATITVTQEGLDFGDQAVLEFGWKPSSLPLQLSISNKWVAAVSVGWISLSNYSGTGSVDINVSVTKNELDEPREGKIIFTSDGKSLEVLVIQSGQYLLLDSTTGEIGAAGGKIELSVENSVATSYEVEYLSNEQDWVSVSNHEGVYSMDISANNSISSRTANLVIRATDGDANDRYQQGIKYLISQSGRDISADVSQINMYSKGGTSDEFLIIADGEYSITKGENDFWFSVIHDPEVNTFRIVCAENNTNAVREGYIILSLINLPARETLEKTIKVKQLDYTFSITIDNYEDDEIVY